MLYLVCHLIKGEAKAFHENLCEELGEKTGILPINRKIPPHLTLKVPFEAISSEIGELESLLENFAKETQVSDYKLKDFDHFGDRVVFMKVEASPEMNQTLDKLTQEYKKLSWLFIHEHDKERTLHASVARLSPPDKIRAAWDYVAPMKAEFDLKFDSIAILKNENGQWFVYREFPFNLSF